MKDRPIFTPRRMRQLYFWAWFLGMGGAGFNQVKAWFYTILILVTCVAFAIRVKTTPKPSPVVETVDEDFERKKQNWAEFLGQMEALQEAAVREPSRPLLHYREEILKLHYLWLEVRDYKFVQYERQKRAQLDAYVARLVADVEKDKRLEEVLSGL